MATTVFRKGCDCDSSRPDFLRTLPGACVPYRHHVVVPRLSVVLRLSVFPRLSLMPRLCVTIKQTPVLRVYVVLKCACVALLMSLVGLFSSDVTEAAYFSVVFFS